MKIHLLGFVFAASAAVCASAQTVYPTGTTIWKGDATWDGVTFFATPGGQGVLVDMAGKALHVWNSPDPNYNLAFAEPIDHGHILAVLAPKLSIGGKVAVELDWQGKVVWAYSMPAALGNVHHELQRLPNGNTLLLADQTITVPNISSKPLLDDLIFEVDPSGNVVWAWFTWQHFDEFGFDPTAKALIAATGGDWAHTNAVFSLPKSRHTAPFLRPGNLIASHRNTNIMFIIDRATSQIVWQMGPIPATTTGQHGVYMIGNDLPGAGDILVFDNGAGTGYPLQGQARGFSRILEIDPATKNPMWDYDAGRSGLFSRLFYSDIVSNAQRLPNGNTMICSGVQGRLFEVTPTYEIVWEYMSPYKAPIFGTQVGPLIYRAYRLPRSWAPSDIDR